MSARLSLPGADDRSSSLAVPGRKRVAAGLLLVFAAVLGTFTAHGAARTFFATGLQAAPLIILGLLAHAARQRAWLRWVTVVLALFGGLCFALIATLLVAAAAGGMPSLVHGRELTQAQLDFLARIAVVFLQMLGIWLAGALTLLPAVRRVIARALPIDPAAFPDAIGLYTAVTLTLMLFASLALSHHVLTDVILASPGSTLDVDPISGNLAVLVWMAAGTFYAAGYGTERDAAQTLARLGFTRLTLRKALFALAGLVALIVINAALDHVVGPVWKHFGWPQTDDSKFFKLLNIGNPVAAFAAACSAGVMEELLTRGLLQPRLGIVVTALFFTSLHAVQYNWDALLTVFFTGLTLGIIRRRSNTTTSAIVHGSYDFVALIAKLAGH